MGPAALCGPGQGRCWCPVPLSTRPLSRGPSCALTRAAPFVLAEGGDLYMWGWNESGQLALPSKAVAEEQEEDEDAGTGEDAAGCSKAVPGPWHGAARAERRCSQGLRSCRPPGSSQAPPSFQSRHSRPCWTCPRTWRLMLSAAGPGTRPQSHVSARWVGGGGSPCAGGDAG